MYISQTVCVFVCFQRLYNTFSFTFVYVCVYLGGRAGDRVYCGNHLGGVDKYADEKKRHASSVTTISAEDVASHLNNSYRTTSPFSGLGATNIEIISDIAKYFYVCVSARLCVCLSFLRVKIEGRHGTTGKKVEVSGYLEYT